MPAQPYLVKGGINGLKPSADLANQTEVEWSFRLI